MKTRSRALIALLCITVFAVGAVPAAAQIEDQISVYSGDNVEGYLAPLSEAFGASLNNGFFYSARIPTIGFRISLEISVMGVFFGDDDRTFNATPEGGFVPLGSATINAPTIVGSGQHVSMEGEGGTQFLFPGGLELNSFGLPVPQLRVGAVGTEAVVRFFSSDFSDDSELGKLSLWGIGARHSISKYVDVPFDLAAGFMYQTFEVGENGSGDNLLSSNALSLGVQASKAIGAGFLSLEPYTGLSYDTFAMDVSYETADGSLDEVSFDRTSNVRFTTGLGFNFVIGHMFAQYDFASRSSFAFGLALGNIGVGIN